MTEQKKDIFDLTETEFLSYFKEKVGPKYEEIKNTKEDLAQILIPVGCLFLFSLFFPPLFFILVIFIIVKISNKNKNIKLMNPFIKEKILNLLGLEYMKCSEIRFSEEYKKIQEKKQIYEKILQETFASPGNVDEIIQSTYQKVPFAVLDVAEQSKPIQYRLCLAFKINKKFYSELWLKDKNSNLSSMRVLSDLFYDTIPFDKDVNLEDVNFSQEYKVYAQDQVEARYLLTPAFMERLLKYKRLKNCGIEVVFTPRYFGLYNLFFYIESNRDMFELPPVEISDIGSTARLFWPIFKEIKEVLTILDTLKLDQDIGM